MQNSLEEDKERTWCLKCFRSEKVCLCRECTPQETQNRFVILMHPLEFKNQKTGSGRLAYLGLKNAELITGVDFTNHSRVNEIIQKEKAVLLYPGKNAVNLSQEKADLKTPMTIFLIDSTWPCAKKMMRLSKNLQELPKICFKSELVSTFRIKQQPNKDCLATIEAINALIKVLKAQELEKKSFDHDLFLRPFKKMISIQEELALNPNQGGYRRKPYKPVNIREVSKKRRNLFYEVD